MRIKSPRIMFFVLIGALFLSTSSVYAKTSEEYFNSGLAYDKQGNWSEAISNYTNAIKKPIKNPKITEPKNIETKRTVIK